MAGEEKKTYKVSKSSTKEGGYATQKKYHATHPEKIKEWRSKYYEPKVRVLQEYRMEIERLQKETGLSLRELFVGAVEEKYGVVLQKHLDDTDEE